MWSGLICVKGDTFFVLFCANKLTRVTYRAVIYSTDITKPKQRVLRLKAPELTKTMNTNLANLDRLGAGARNKKPSHTGKISEGCGTEN